MPCRERDCADCGARYEVFVFGARTIRTSDGQEPPLCPRCGGADFRTVFNLDFRPVALGGEAGVGRFYPYYDRALGPGKDGRGILVRDAKHREHLCHYTPEGAKREARLIPLDSKSDSALRGTWEDIADRDAAEAEADAKVYNEMVAELAGGENREAYHRTQQAVAERIGTTEAT